METPNEYLPSTELATKSNANLKRESTLIQGDELVRRIADYPDEERDLIMWFYHHLRDRGIGYDGAGKFIAQDDGTPYSRDSVYQLLTGRRQSRDGMLEAIRKFKEIVLAEQAAKRAPFIETSLTAKIFKYCDLVGATHRMGWILGDTQIGKTEALEEYQRRNNHGRTVYVRVGVGGYISDFIQRLSKALGISTALACHKAKVRIFDCLKANNLLIVDELHLAFMPETLRSYHILEFCREIFDLCKCGVVLCGTEVLRETFANGVHKKVATQARRRGLQPLVLESRPLRADLDKFAAHYNLKPATAEAFDLQKEVIREDGLGMWITYLAGGQRRAEKAKRPMTWEDVIKVHASQLKLSQPPTEE